MEKILKSYRTLGLEPGASAAQVKKAYRELVKVWHPDQFAGDAQKREEAELKLREINVAFEQLQDATPELSLIAALQAAYRKAEGSKAQHPKQQKPPVPSKPTAKPSARAPQGPPTRPHRPHRPRQPRPAAPDPNHSRNRRSVRHSRVERFFGRSPAPLIALTAGMLAFATAVAFWPSPNHESAIPPSAEPYISVAEITSRPPPSRGQIAPGGESTDYPMSDMLAGTEPEDHSVALPNKPEEPRSEISGQPSPSHDHPDTKPSSIAEPSSTLELVQKLKATKLDTHALPEVDELPSDAERAERQFQTGLRYANGTGVPRDYREAAIWYRLAAEAGHAQAQRNLGFLYGAGKGVPKDYSEAAKWLAKASAESELQVAGALVAAMAKAESEADTLSAADIARQAEDHFQRGRNYATGKSGSRDFVQAAKWYRLAAEAGHAQAQKNLGLLYVSGRGVPKDDEEAEKWLRKAQAQGIEGLDLTAALLSIASTNGAAPPE